MKTLYCPVCAHSNSEMAHSCASCGHPLPASNAKKKSIALLLWFFIGGLGAHRFYLGDPLIAIAMLLMVFSVFFFAALGIDAMAILSAIGVLWVFCDGIYLACKGKDYYMGKTNG